MLSSSLFRSIWMVIAMNIGYVVLCSPISSSISYDTAATKFSVNEKKCTSIGSSSTTAFVTSKNRGRSVIPTRTLIARPSDTASRRICINFGKQDDSASAPERIRQVNKDTTFIGSSQSAISSSSTQYYILDKNKSDNTEQQISKQLCIPLVTEAKLFAINDNAVLCVLSIEPFCNEIQTSTTNEDEDETSNADHYIGLRIIEPPSLKRSNNNQQQQMTTKQLYKYRKQQQKVFQTTTPFYIDLLQHVTSNRGSSGGDDMLLKAVKPSAHGGAIIYDLTAGLGQDGMLLAVAGAKHVYMYERHPIVGCLLQDAVRRLRSHSDLGTKVSLQILDGTNIVMNTVSTNVVDDDDVFSSLQQPLPDIVYLDPMFPVRKRSALVKKNMQVLHTILHSQEESNTDSRLRQEQELLATAWDLAKYKVIVKRPNSAPPIGYDDTADEIPTSRTTTVQVRSYTHSGPNCRWDVYLKTN